MREPRDSAAAAKRARFSQSRGAIPPPTQAAARPLFAQALLAQGAGPLASVAEASAFESDDCGLYEQAPAPGLSYDSFEG